MCVTWLAARPVAVPDQYTQAPTGDTVVPAAAGILANDTVPCGSAATVRVVTPPAHGTVTSIANDGSYTYSPDDPLFPVDDSFVYELNCNGLVSYRASHMIAASITPQYILTDTVNMLLQ